MLSTRLAGRGRMLVVDASALYEVLTGGRRAEPLRRRLIDDPDQGAPHAIEAEVIAVIRREESRGRLDPTAAYQAVDDLRDWPGERYGHRGLLDRVWELRANVRTWDGLYVALAEALDATLVTLDARLARVPSLPCRVDVPSLGNS